MKIDKLAQILVMATSTAFAANAFAATPEVEVNDSTGQAQVLTTLSVISVKAMIGFAEDNNSKDVDFYQFTAKEGDVLTIDINNGYKENAPLNTILAVYGPAPEYKLERTNIIAASIDSGSISTKDARIDDFVVPADGVYTIGVSRYPTFFYKGGIATKLTFLYDNNTITDYTLDVTGASVTGPKKINIAVKPGNDEVTPINPRARGKIPVAILGSSSFSAVNVDTSTLTFGSTGNELSLSKCAKSGEDVNGDGHYDLICHFENQLAHFKNDDLEGILKGETRTGEAFEGRAPLKVVPAKTK